MWSYRVNFIQSFLKTCQLIKFWLEAYNAELERTQLWKLDSTLVDTLWSTHFGRHALVDTLVDTLWSRHWSTHSGRHTLVDTLWSTHFGRHTGRHCLINIYTLSTTFWSTTIWSTWSLVDTLVDKIFGRQGLWSTSTLVDTILTDTVIQWYKLLTHSEWKTRKINLN